MHTMAFFESNLQTFQGPQFEGISQASGLLQRQIEQMATWLADVAQQDETDFVPTTAAREFWDSWRIEGVKVVDAPEARRRMGIELRNFSLGPDCLGILLSAYHRDCLPILCQEGSLSQAQHQLSLSSLR